DAPDDRLVTIARGQLAELLGITADPLLVRVSRYAKAMPQYQVGHLARVDAIEQCLRHHDGLALAGAGYRGVGVADCARSGEAAMERLLAKEMIPLPSGEREP